MIPILLTFWITCGLITVRDEWDFGWGELFACFAFGWLWQILKFTPFTDDQL